MTRLALVTALLLVFASGFAVAQESPVTHDGWSKEAVRLFATLPIQEGGRIKPMGTFAGFELLKFNGRRVCEDLNGHELDPTAWLMDCLYYPELARQYTTFLVQDAAVLDAAGIIHAGHKRRDRYSYDELLPGRENLMGLAQQFDRIEERNRSPLQQQTLNLAMNLLEFEGLIQHMAFARYRFDFDADSSLSALLKGDSYMDVIRRAKGLRLAILALDQGFEALEQQLPPADVGVFRDALPQSLQGLGEATRQNALDELEQVLKTVDQLSAHAAGLAVFPPEDPEAAEWLSPADVASKAFLSNEGAPESVALLDAYVRLARTADDKPAFLDALKKYHSLVTAAARSRDEYRHIPLEVTFYKAQFFYYSLILYILAFLVVAFSWLRPTSRIMHGLTLASLVAPTLLLIVGITMRCIIRGRPPVTTLYETILFITAVAVCVCIFMEVVNRRKIAGSVGAVLGMLGMFLAYKYEVREGADTMPSMIAVLDTNFWLSTHVTTVTIGYAAGLLGAALSHLYIVGRLFHFKGNDREFYKALTRMTYGVICFGLVFSVVGTVLGGIWAAESWGRFWGWDPKENGALMIVLWELAILHARRGGYIREQGLHLSSIVNGMIVGFSWWGVNLLGVGLHSYGWTSGILRALLTFFIIEAGILAMGGLLWYREKLIAAVHKQGKQT